MPVNWIGPDQTSGVLYSPLFAPPATTETTFAQVIPALRDGGKRLNGLSFVARPKTDKQWGSGFKVDIAVP